MAAIWRGGGGPRRGALGQRRHAGTATVTSSGERGANSCRVGRGYVPPGDASRRGEQHAGGRCSRGGRGGGASFVGAASRAVSRRWRWPPQGGVVVMAATGRAGGRRRRGVGRKRPPPGSGAMALSGRRGVNCRRLKKRHIPPGGASRRWGHHRGRRNLRVLFSMNRASAAHSAVSFLVFPNDCTPAPVVKMHRVKNECRGTVAAHVFTF